MKLRRGIRLGTAVSLVGVLLAASGCSSKSDAGAGSNGHKGLDKVTYMTSFGNFGRDAYVWEAMAKGYFKDAGIDITIKPGTGTGNVQLLAAGKVQFTAVDFSGGIIQIAKAKSPLNIQAIAVAQQHSMAALMVLPGSGIENPADLAGKKIASTPGSVDQLLFPAYAHQAGFNGTADQFESAKATQLAGLLAAHKVDAIDQFVVGVPSVQLVTKQAPIVFPYSKYLTDLYGNAIWTSKDLIKNNPDLVRRFLGALLKGLQAALDDPDGAGKALAANVQGSNAGAAAAELRLMTGYVRADPDPIGTVTQVRVARMVATLESTGAIPQGTDPDGLVAWNFVPGQKKS